MKCNFFKVRITRTSKTYKVVWEVEAPVIFETGSKHASKNVQVLVFYDINPISRNYFIPWLPMDVCVNLPAPLKHQPVSTISTRINLYQPASTGINPNQPESIGINRNQPKST